jgi:hypothetical protein
MRDVWEGEKNERRARQYDDAAALSKIDLDTLSLEEAENQAKQMAQLNNAIFKDTMAKLKKRKAEEAAAGCKVAKTAVGSVSSSAPAAAGDSAAAAAAALDEPMEVGRCAGTTARGLACKCKARAGGRFCGKHTVQLAEDRSEQMLASQGATAPPAVLEGYKAIVGGNKVGTSAGIGRGGFGNRQCAPLRISCELCGQDLGGIRTVQCSGHTAASVRCAILMPPKFWPRASHGVCSGVHC